MRRLAPWLFGWLAVAAAAADTRADMPLDQRRSAYEMMAPATRAMQDDDSSNPAMLSVLDGEAIWRAKTGEAAKACADCHGDAKVTMRGVAARHPAFDAAKQRAVSLEQRINACRAERQRAPQLGDESSSLLAIAAYVGLQSRGLQIESGDPRLGPAIEAGRQLYFHRQGQLNLSCAQCHDDNWGRKLAGSTIPQAHPTGYPVYRLEWQAVGSLQRRLRNCLTGMRAETYPYGSPELVALETYLMWRARGMPLETPGVRP